MDTSLLHGPDREGGFLWLMTCRPFSSLYIYIKFLRMGFFFLILSFLRLAMIRIKVTDVYKYRYELIDLD